MIPDGSYRAVTDRIEDGVATLLLEEDGTDAYQLDVDPAELPSAGRHCDAILTIEVPDGSLVESRYDLDETDARAESARSRFERLSERPPDDSSDDA